MYSEADYYRHVDAEKHMLNKDSNYSQTDLPEDWRQSSTSGDSDDAASLDDKWPVRQRSKVAKEEVGPVAATTSDADAERMWGRGQKEPEFYI